GMAIGIEAAVQLDHPILPGLVAGLEPFAHRFAFEGIRARLHGSVARFVAMGHSALGHGDEAVAFARQAMDANASAGMLLVAHSQMTLAEALTCRGKPGDLEEAGRLDAAGTRALADFGVDVKRLRHRAPPADAE